MNKKVVQEGRKTPKKEDKKTVNPSPTTNPSLIFDVYEIANKAPGASVTYNLDGVDLDLSKFDIHTKGPIEGKVVIMKIEDEYNVSIKDFKTTVELTCEKCLEKFDFVVDIPYTEMQFLITGDHSDNGFDFFYVDTKTHTVDIEEFLRQEIILHFPLVAVCSPHCKGINLN